MINFVNTFLKKSNKIGFFRKVLATVTRDSLHFPISYSKYMRGPALQ